MVKVRIIVPIYGVEQYLRETVDSILSINRNHNRKIAKLLGKEILGRSNG